MAKLKRPSLTQMILLSMVIGTLVGWAFPEASQQLKPLSTIFLRMIKSIIAPIIFATLVIGIAGHGDDMKRVGRLALKSIIYFEIVTTLALFIGLAAVNLTRPGVGVVLAGADATKAQEMGQTAQGLTVGGFLEHVVPTSIVDAMTKNEVLQIVFWSILFAVALSQVRGRPKEMMLWTLEGLSEVMFKFTGIVMKYAPIGIGAAIAVTVGHSGLGILWNLGKLILTLYGALVVFGLVVLLPVALLAKVPLKRFIRAVKDPALIAFSTTSSEAALPRAMQAMEAIGVPRRIVAFVMPTGYSFNLDGTAIYLTMASLFVASAMGDPLTVKEQISLLVFMMIASKGAAGVTGAGLATLAGGLASHRPDLVDGVGLIVGIDRFMSEARAVTNFAGNAVATVLVGTWTRTLDREQLDAVLAGQRPFDEATMVDDHHGGHDDDEAEVAGEDRVVDEPTLTRGR
jgi:proton glutamate symport protein